MMETNGGMVQMFFDQADTRFIHNKAGLKKKNEFILEIVQLQFIQQKVENVQK